MIYRYRTLLKRIKRLAHGSDCALYLHDRQFFVLDDLRALDDFSPLNPENRIPDSISRVDFSDFPEEFSAVEYLVTFVAANTWPPLQSVLSQLIQALRP